MSNLDKLTEKLSSTKLSWKTWFFLITIILATGWAANQGATVFLQIDLEWRISNLENLSVEMQRLTIEQVLNSSFYPIQKQCSYLVNKVGAYTTMQDGVDAKLKWWDTDSSAVFNAVSGNASTIKGSIFIKTEDYNITSYIALKNNTGWVGEGWGTRLFLGDNRPNGEAADWVNHCIFLHQSGTLENVTIQDLQLDGNKANQAIGSVTHGIANIYVGGSANAIRIFNDFSHSHLRYGVFFSSAGEIYDVKVDSCTVIGNNYNDISFQAGNGELFNCVAIGNTVGGDTGDIGIDTEVWGTGHVHHVVITDNIVSEMTGTGGSGGGSNWYGIRLEKNSSFCTVSDNTLYNAFIGIATHTGGIGRHLIIGNQIYLKSVNDSRGIHIFDDYNEVTNNYIYGVLGTGEIGIFSESTASYNGYALNHVENISTGIWVKGDYEDFKNNKIFSCTTPVGFHGDASNYVFKFNVGFVTENSGTQTCADQEWIAHELAGTPTMVQATSGNCTYDSVSIIANYVYSSMNTTHFQANIYWANSTAIDDDVILFSWYAEYKP